MNEHLRVERPDASPKTKGRFHIASFAAHSKGIGAPRTKHNFICHKVNATHAKRRQRCTHDAKSNAPFSNEEQCLMHVEAWTMRPCSHGSLRSSIDHAWTSFIQV